MTRLQLLQGGGSREPGSWEGALARSRLKAALRVIGPDDDEESAAAEAQHLIAFGDGEPGSGGEAA